jgi:hypothetical protein
VTMSDTKVAKPLPHSVEAEHALLGSVLLDNAVLSAIFDKIAVLDFFLLQHRKIFTAMRALHDAQKPIDTVALMDALGDDLEAAGGAAYLSALPDGLQAQRIASVLHYVDIIKKHSVRRALIHSVESESEAAFAGEDPATIIERLRKKFSEIEITPSTETFFDTPTEFEITTPLNFAIEGFLQCEAATLLAGLSGDYKTWIALSVSKALLDESTELWNTFTIRHKAERIVYLIPESSRGPFRYRLETMRLMPYVSSGRLLVRTLSKGPAPLLQDPRILAVTPGTHVFLDTAVRFMTGDENSAHDNARGLATDIFQLLGASARSVIAIAHSPKSFAKDGYMSLENMVRGSGDIGATFATAWGVRKLPGDIAHIQNIKPRDFEPCRPFQLAARPYLADLGDFKLHKPPFSCGTLADEMPDPRKGRAPKSDAKKSNIEILRQYLNAEPSLSDNQIVQRFREAGIHLNRTTVLRYRKELEED